ncbi:hypothetical protein QJS04_geneDACA018352 [Acorus gramineus]|uniref:Uncharacterized protein n=1 Tax=Acorus gramineus TaxID=55184 RepID=A0AAV9A1Y1_ACOGR|nr:hypothetical protein QJS04_geneDACA018352 [Acorus gramineus]
MCILRYLRGTITRLLLHLSSSLTLILRAYTDADCCGNPTTRLSTIGFCMFLGDSIISWRNKKRKVSSVFFVSLLSLGATRNTKLFVCYMSLYLDWSYIILPRIVLYLYPVWCYKRLLSSLFSFLIKYTERLFFEPATLFFTKGTNTERDCSFAFLFFFIKSHQVPPFQSHSFQFLFCSTMSYDPDFNLEFLNHYICYIHVYK